MGKRTRRGQDAAASSRPESAEQPATSVPSEPPAKRARRVQHAAASRRSESAEQPATSVPSEPPAKRPRRASGWSVKARKNKEHQVGQLRLSQQIRWAQYDYSQGRKLSDMVKDNTRKSDDLTANEQQLVEDFETRSSAKKLDELMGQKALQRLPV